MNNNNCFTGVDIPNPITEPCGGIYTSTECIVQESAIPYLDLPANSSVKNIINNLVLALLYKDEQIVNQTTIIESLQEQVLSKYKVYTALLSQTNTDDPIPTIFENTLGDIVWTYEGNGVSVKGNFKGALVGAFLEGKTYLTITPFADGDTSKYKAIPVIFDSEDYIKYNTLGTDLTFQNQDGISVLIEIRVYN